MVEQRPPTKARPASQQRTLREAWARARRNPDGTEKRTPMPVLVILLVLFALMVPLFLLGNSEDLVYSASTTGTQGAGGETATSTSTGPGRTTTTICRDAPVEFEVDGQQYSGTDVVRGECVPSGDTRAVTVRYVPDDPDDFTTNGRQWILYGFAGAAALGFLVTLVAVVRRVLSRRRERRAAAPTGTLSP